MGCNIKVRLGAQQPQVRIASELRKWRRLVCCQPDGKQQRRSFTTRRFRLRTQSAVNTSTRRQHQGMVAPASKPVQQRILRRRCGCRRCQVRREILLFLCISSLIDRCGVLFSVYHLLRASVVSLVFLLFCANIHDPLLRSISINFSHQLD